MDTLFTVVDPFNTVLDTLYTVVDNVCTIVETLYTVADPFNTVVDTLYTVFIHIIYTVVYTFLLLQQTAVQSSILFLSRTVDRISQTCLVVKKSTPQAAAI